MTQVRLIFHQDYSWINAFSVLLGGLLKFMFKTDEKTAFQVDRDMTARPQVHRARRFITERFPVICDRTRANRLAKGRKQTFLGLVYLPAIISDCETLNQF